MSDRFSDPTIFVGDARMAGTITEVRREAEMLKTGALQNAILNSANFSSIATDAKGVIQIFNVGAERMLGYAAADVVDKITPADISDPQEVIARAKALSVELDTPITPGFEALVFKASRGIEDIYELTYIRKDGSRFPAVVSVTALRDTQGAIIGYLLIGTDNTERRLILAALNEKAQDLAALEERQRIARELHDSVAQALFGMNLYAEVAARSWQAGDTAQMLTTLQELRTIAQEALSEMRLLIFELRTPVLETDGLVAALQHRLEAVETRAGLKTAMHIDDDWKTKHAAEEMLYRVAIEALNNSLKHAKATAVTISLRCKGTTASLEVADDGVGFDALGKRDHWGFGLTGMFERVAAFGGELQIDSAVGQGTRVKVSAPDVRATTGNGSRPSGNALGR